MYGKTLAGVMFTLTLLSSNVSRAEPCPTPATDETQIRRTLAKQWFSRAEDSESAGDRDMAVRRYACSLRLVPHPSTAYNLGVAAERSGDLSMATDAFRAYLRLLPNAPDRVATEDRIGRLEEQLLELRRQFDDPVPARGLNKVKATNNARLVAGRDPEQLPALPMPDPSPLAERRVPLWPLFAGAAVTTGTGIIFNLVARARMTTCRDPQLRMSDRALADEACTSAPPFAYGSYALLGLGGALGAVGAYLALRDGGGSARTALSVSPTRDGATLTVLGGF